MKTKISLKLCLLIASVISWSLAAGEKKSDDLNSIFIKHPTTINNTRITGHKTIDEVSLIIEDFLQGSIPMTSIEGVGLWTAMSGGDIIGNGGGLGESFYQYALLELPSFIQECLNSQFCKIDESERHLLNQISNIARLNNELDYALLFVKPEKQHTLFLQEDGLVRSAITGREPHLPVFLNLDHMYKDNKIDIALLDAVRILIHEIGHQVGEENHSYLDKLGAKIHQFINLQSVKRNSITDTNNNHYELWLKNPDTFEMTSFSVFFAKNGKQQDLKDLFLDHLKCPEGLSVLDYKFQNLHWIKSEDNKINKVGAWANIQCSQEESGLVYDILLDNIVITIK